MLYPFIMLEVPHGDDAAATATTIRSRDHFRDLYHERVGALDKTQDRWRGEPTELEIINEIRHGLDTIRFYTSRNFDLNGRLRDSMTSPAHAVLVDAEYPNLRVRG